MLRFFLQRIKPGGVELRALLVQLFLHRIYVFRDLTLFLFIPVCFVSLAEDQEMMLRVELRPLAASIVVVIRQLDPSQVLAAPLPLLLHVCFDHLFCLP